MKRITHFYIVADKSNKQSSDNIRKSFNTAFTNISKFTDKVAKNVKKDFLDINDDATGMILLVVCLRIVLSFKCVESSMWMLFCTYYLCVSFAVVLAWFYLFVTIFYRIALTMPFISCNPVLPIYFYFT